MSKLDRYLSTEIARSVLAALVVLSMVSLGGLLADLGVLDREVSGDQRFGAAGFGNAEIADGLRGFVSDSKHNPLRSNLFDVDGVVSAAGFPFAVPAALGGTAVPLINVSTIRPRTSRLRAR